MPKYLTTVIRKLRKVVINNLGSTPSSGLSLINSSLATDGNQQVSPSVIFEGQGWKTNAVSESQKTEFRLYLVPVQDAISPKARLDFGYAINDGAFVTAMSLLNGNVSILGGSLRIDSGDGIGDILTPNGGGTAIRLTNSGAFYFGTHKYFTSASIQAVVIDPAGTTGLGLDNLSPTGTLHVYDATVTTGITKQTLREGAGQSTTSLLVLQDSAGANPVGITRNAAGILEINNGTVGTFRDLILRAIQWSTGARPAANATNRGLVWYVAGGAGVADTFEICRKDAADVYAWVTLF